MIDLSVEEKEQMVQQRLRQYAAQKFSLELDVAAYQAVGDKESVDLARAEIEKIEKASAAIRELLK